MPATTMMNKAIPPQLRRLAAKAPALPENRVASGAKYQVLDGALRCFAEKNFAGGSIRDIAVYAHLKPASLYSHYRSKEEMLTELIHIGHQEHHDRLQGAVALAGHSSVDKLIAWMKAHVEFHARFPMLATVINHELHSLPSQHIEKALSFRHSASTLLKRTIEQGVAQGEFDTSLDIDLTALAIAGIGMRVANWFYHGCGYELTRVVEEFTRYATRLVGAPLDACDTVNPVQPNACITS